MLFGSSAALQKIGLLANMFFRFFFAQSSCLVRLNQAQVSTQDTVGFSPSRRTCLGAVFSLKSCSISPRPAKICLAFLRPARCAWFFPRARSAVVRFFLGFGARLAGGSLLSSLSLSLSLSLVSCCSFRFSLLGAATLFQCPVLFWVDCGALGPSGLPV